MKARKTVAVAIFLGALLVGSSLSSLVMQARAASTGSCTIGPRHKNLATSSDAQLRKLAQYESVCGGAPTRQLMMFTGMPTTTEEAASMAADMAGTLKEYARFSITPLVMLEPTTTNDATIDLTAYQAGNYDQAMQAYFHDLRVNGITDQMMGTWAPFPEANTPSWGNSDPSVFSTNFTKTVGWQKQVFPASKATMLLNSQSYPSNDTTWDHGSYASLLPYVQHIPKGTVDSFGYQGFPWAPPAKQAGPSQLAPSGFLPAKLAIEAARALGVSRVWLNTGTYSRMYADQPSRTITLSRARRAAMLSDINRQGLQLQKAKLAVTINLFAQDKSTTPEHVDWSYWHSNTTKTSPDTGTFKTYARNVHAHGFELSLYDD